jgi:hypothetical protein
MKIYGAQLTGSIASKGDPVVTGSLTVSGNLTAQQFIVSSSVTFLTTSFSSGSTRFGDSSDDNHNFTGSVVMTGSLTVVTNGNEFQVNAGGVNIGNALTDNHVISGSIRINPNGLFVSSSGFVGIGTTSPGQLLEVVGGEIKAGRVDSNNEGGQVSFGRSTDNNTSWYIDAYGNVASPQLRFVNVSDSLVAMTITGSNVGIGTTSPTFPNGNGLVVYASDFPRIQLKNSTSGDTSTDGAGLILVGNDYYISNRETGNMIFENGANSERMRITSGGYTKMSNAGTYQNSTGAFHEMWSNTAGSNVAYIRHADTTGNPYGIEIDFRSAPNNSTNHFIYMGDNLLGRAAIYSNGSYFSRTGVYATVSDITLKENISPATAKLEDLLKVNIVNYNFIGEEDKYIGVIAQELEEIFPNMIILDGKTGKKGVKYSIFVPMLIKAIQEQQAQINELKSLLNT